MVGVVTSWVSWSVLQRMCKCCASKYARRVATTASTSTDGAADPPAETSSSKQFITLSEKCVSSCFVVGFLFYPTVCNQTFQLLSCIPIGDRFFMTNDLDIECYVDERHIWYTNYIGMPMLFVYVVGIPAGSAVILYMNRHVLGQFSMRVKYMMLCAGYRPERYYWEVVVMLRKTIMVGIAVFGRRFGVELQAYSGILLLAVCLGLQIHFSPFVLTSTAWDPSKGYHGTGGGLPLLNNLESMALVTNFLTLYLGLLFHTNNEIMTLPMTILLTIFLVSLNLLFMVWAMLMYVHQLHREGRVDMLDRIFRKWNSLQHEAAVRVRERRKTAVKLFQEKSEKKRNLSLAVAVVPVDEEAQELEIAATATSIIPSAPLGNGDNNEAVPVNAIDTEAYGGDNKKVLK